ncbi:MAG: hypothetical protein OIF55_21170, partial [Amphritea sp.]|nr:hypothetical protein [Amphritea sp.]
MDRVASLVVVKDRVVNDDRGVVKPVLAVDNDGNYKTLDQSRFPTGIYISRGYSNLDTTYDDNQLFLLQDFHKDQEKSAEDGVDRYWAFGKDTVAIPTNSLLPVVHTQLPNVETGILPESVQPPRGLFFIIDDDQHKMFGPMQATSVPGE